MSLLNLNIGNNKSDGSSSGLEKLLEFGTEQCGKLFEPFHIKRIGKAQNEMIVKKAEAEAEAEIRKRQILNDAAKDYPALGRIIHNEEKREENIHSVFNYTKQYLESPEVSEQEVSKEKVNSDWGTRFMNIVQDVSENEMQKLWAKILAGEIIRPKSYSLRTLELLKNISFKEAKLFELFSGYIVRHGQTYLCPYELFDNLKSEKVKFGFDELFMLKEIGLVVQELGIGYTITIEKGEKTPFVYQNKALIARPKNDGRSIVQFNRVAVLTSIGKEIFTLANLKFDRTYCDELKELLLQNYKVEVADIKKIVNNVIYT